MNPAVFNPSPVAKSFGSGYERKNPGHERVGCVLRVCNHGVCKNIIRLNAWSVRRRVADTGWITRRSVGVYGSSERICRSVSRCASRCVSARHEPRRGSRINCGIESSAIDVAEDSVTRRLSVNGAARTAGFNRTQLLQVYEEECPVS